MKWVATIMSSAITDRKKSSCTRATACLSRRDAGSSSTLLEYSIPYARASLAAFVAQTNDTTTVAADPPLPKCCSVQMAQRMAHAAWVRGQRLLQQEQQQQEQQRDAQEEGEPEPPLQSRFLQTIGIGCTAALATNYEKKGPHESFLTVCRAAASTSTSGSTSGAFHRPVFQSYHIHFDKAAKRTRAGTTDSRLPPSRCVLQQVLPT